MTQKTWNKPQNAPKDRDHAPTTELMTVTSQNRTVRVSPEQAKVLRGINELRATLKKRGARGAAG